MKLNKFLVAAMVAMALFSCSKENSGNDPDPDQDLTGQTAVSFTFKTVMSKSSETDADESPDVGDINKIKNFRLLIFNNQTKACEYNELFPAGTTKAVAMVTPGAKKIYIMANTEGNDYMEGGTTTMDAIIAKYTKGGSYTLTNFLSESFFASSGNANLTAFSLVPLHQGTVTAPAFPMSSSDAKTYTLNADIDEATASGADVSGGDVPSKNAFLIGLDYMLSKVSVKLKSDYTVDGGTIENAKFTLQNLARQTYFIRQFAGTDTKSPYYSMFTSTSLQAEFDPHFNYKDVPGPANGVVVNTSAIAAGDYIYAAENTNMSLRIGQATYAALKLTFMPSTVYLESGITYNSGTQKVQLGTPVSYSTPETFVVSKIDGIAEIPVGTYFESVAALTKAVGIAIYKGDYDPTDPHKDGSVYVIKRVIPGTGTCDEYVNGDAWYRINVGDNANNASNKTVWGIVRSNKYDITINRITGPGYPYEEDLRTDPTDPEYPGFPLDEQTAVAVTIKVNGWNAKKLITDI